MRDHEFFPIGSGTKEVAGRSTKIFEMQVDNRMGEYSEPVRDSLKQAVFTTTANAARQLKIDIPLNLLISGSLTATIRSDLMKKGRDKERICW